MNWTRLSKQMYSLHANLDGSVHGLPQVYHLAIRSPRVFFVALQDPRHALAESLDFQRTLQKRINTDLQELYCEASRIYGKALDHEALYEDILAIAKEMVLYWYLYADVTSWLKEQGLLLAHQELWKPCELLDLVPVEHHVSTWISTALSSGQACQMERHYISLLRQLENLVLPDRVAGQDEHAGAASLCRIKWSE